MSARPLLVIEVLDARGGVASRTRIDALPATIGRGYANDVVIDDPFVDPTHLRIVLDESGALVAEDHDSVNGLRASGSPNLVARLTLSHGAVLSIGRTSLRFYDPTESVVPALADARRLREEPSTEAAPAWLSSRRARWAAVLAAVAIQLASTYAGTVERATGAKLITAALALLLIIALWAGVWALAGRLATHRVSFTSHLALAAAAFAVGAMLNALAEWMTFLWPDGAVSAMLTLSANAALFAALLYGHLGVASSMGRRRRMNVSLVVIGALIALGGLFALADQEKFTTKMNFDEQLKPLSTRFVPTVSVDEFARASRTLRTAADANVSGQSK